MMVWQDQVSGGSNPPWTRLAPNPKDAEWKDADHEQFLKEFEAMVDREFPGGAPASWQGVSRRNFLRLMGARIGSNVTIMSWSLPVCTDLLTIGDAMQRMGLDPRQTSLKVGVLGAEPWTEEMRHELEQMFDIDACDIYGLSEVMGPGVAGESNETKDGSHIWEDHFRPEILDPFDETKVLGDGEPGELVFTALTKQALPIIRYRTHDLSRLLPGTERPGHRRMGRITGRSDDMIILRGVNVFPSQIEELALKVEGLSPHFQLEITRPGRMDQLAVKIERRVDCTSDRALAAAGELQKLIKIHVGSSCQIDVVDPESLPRSVGKLKRSHDLRNL